MPNYAPPTELTGPQLRSVSGTLRQIADGIDGAASVADSTKTKSLFVFGVPTAHQSIGKLRNFVRQVQESADSAGMGSPYSERSRKTNHGVKTIEEEVAEDKANLIADMNQADAKHGHSKPQKKSDSKRRGGTK